MTKDQLFQLSNNLEVINRLVNDLKGTVDYINYVWDEETKENHPNNELEELKTKFEYLKNYISEVSNSEKVDTEFEVQGSLPRLEDVFGEELEGIPEAK